VIDAGWSFLPIHTNKSAVVMQLMNVSVVS